MFYIYTLSAINSPLFKNNGIFADGECFFLHVYKTHNDQLWHLLLLWFSSLSFFANLIIGCWKREGNWFCLNNGDFYGVALRWEQCVNVRRKLSIEIIKKCIVIIGQCFFFFFFNFLKCRMNLFDNVLLRQSEYGWSRRRESRSSQEAQRQETSAQLHSGSSDIRFILYVIY